MTEFENLATDATLVAQYLEAALLLMRKHDSHLFSVGADTMQETKFATLHVSKETFRELFQDEANVNEEATNYGGWAYAFIGKTKVYTCHSKAELYGGEVNA